MASAEKTKPVIEDQGKEKPARSQRKTAKATKDLKGQRNTEVSSSNSTIKMESIGNGMIELQIPFGMLIQAVTKLSLDDKERLWLLLQDQISQEETDWLMNDPKIQADIAQAIADYEAGDYMTLEEYNTQRRQSHKKK